MKFVYHTGNRHGSQGHFAVDKCGNLTKWCYDPRFIELWLVIEKFLDDGVAYYEDEDNLFLDNLYLKCLNFLNENYPEWLKNSVYLNEQSSTQDIIKFFEDCLYVDIPDNTPIVAYWYEDKYYDYTNKKTISCYGEKVSILKQTTHVLNGCRCFTQIPLINFGA